MDRTSAPQTPIRILLLEDVASDAELEMRSLQKFGLAITFKVVSTEREFRSELSTFYPDIILSDYTLPGAFDGLMALSIAREISPDIPFIFVSGTIGEERAIEAMKLGATDYVIKTNLKRFPQSVLRAIQESSERIQKRETERALHESEKRFSLFMRNLPGVATLKQTDGSYVFVNDHWRSIFKPKEEDIAGLRIDNVWPPEIAEKMRNADQEVIESRHATQTVFHLPVLGKDCYWLISRFPITDDTGRVILIGSVGIDISEREEQKLKIFRLNRIHEILTGINAMIVRTQDKEELIQSACRIITEYGGYPLVWIAPKEIGESRPFSLSIESAEQAGNEPTIRRFIQTNRWILEKQLQSLSGSPLILNDVSDSWDPDFSRDALEIGLRAFASFPLISGGRDLGTLTLTAREPSMFDEEEVSLYVELSRDIAFALDALEKSERLKYLAYYDALTGLPNRALFLDRLSQALYLANQEQRQMTVLVLKVERHQAINDTMGRHVGDSLIRMIAERLKSATLLINSVARVLDDCFGVIINNAGPQKNLEGELLRIFQEPFPIGKELFRIVIKAGIAHFPRDGHDAETLFRNACAALVSLRKSPQPVGYYQEGMNERAARAMSLENRLHRALENNQFLLYYQPKIDFMTGEISGMEALLRWNDADQGIVPPGVFIPILEESGAILEVGKWAFSQAISDIVRWREKGLSVPRIAVNVSPIQLRHSGFLPSVEKILKSAGDPPPELEIEITESVIMENAAMNIMTLRDLRARNLSIAIDDFGTGYSSLSYIAQLPVDKLKIDRSFIMNLGTTADSQTIVSTIISLAHSLGLKVVAEGVENREQYRLLVLLKCDEFQGFFFKPPLSPEKIEPLLMDRDFRFVPP